MKAEISQRNSWWIPKERYYELVHFCKQYAYWQHSYDVINKCIGDIKTSNKEKVQISEQQDLTAEFAEALEYYSNKMDMVRRCCYEAADSSVAPYIFKCVTEGLSYDKMNAKDNLPVSRAEFYERCRQFFWELSKVRE